MRRLETFAPNGRNPETDKSVCHEVLINALNGTFPAELQGAEAHLVLLHYIAKIERMTAIIDDQKEDLADKQQSIEIMQQTIRELRDARGLGVSPSDQVE